MTSTIDAAVPAGGSPPAPPRADDGRSSGRRRRPLGQALTPYLLLAPAVVALLALVGWPAVLVVLTSFRKMDLGELVRGELVWTGFDNYTTVLGDAEFWKITLRTVAFTAACVVATLLGGLVIALLLRQLGRVVRTVLQVCMVLAWAMPVLAATTVFQWVFDQRYGILNKTLVLVGLDSFEGHNWFATGPSTLTVIGILVCWQAIPFVAFSLYAGLLGIPRELYEAAGMDGANAWQTFRSVTWPTLRPIVLMMTFLQLLWDFKVFAQVWAFRQGGPNGESTTLPVLQYLKGIAGSHFGVAAAVSVLMVLVLLVLTVQYLRMLVRSQEVDL
ncbi:N,N'-diacetylchitobiose transport system permease protein [Streptoalloteichus tenebrarius]|uniref:N,N'-diacetylchitobiose transport system permease protein n=1 Tax=Streptoalloteichus tenebrarius (strain ATCC 17920 / DSM 40477 / JCM 4838 / CBS 697.72 / NBRC 16177 / NCIMB 11028 / NRRL B-12390 / A12253. 1 / ISP 5477) TaxID=1933 RepID=A0ABT1HYL9_STRSD|nr:sugar ABC transporter permease [Streptoalloteichus tenebrarius]MCP2260621.1 N,N'-diacetylchitobiose transport system permease protein [Streptoalloteichus tenebrarius]BFF01504.1 sugar ABC transporter permease [Streptoalloteichus tenebrarius]